MGVPGTVSGLELALARYGTMQRPALIAPALHRALRGFVLEQGDVDMLHSAADAFRRDPASAAICLNQGQPFAVGQRLVQMDLAATLQSIAERGAAGFYQGAVGAAIVASSRAGKGILSQAELDQYQTRELKPVACNDRSYGGGALPERGDAPCLCRPQQLTGRPRLRQPPTRPPARQGLCPAKIRAAIGLGVAGVSQALKPGVAPRGGSNTLHYAILDKAGNAVAVIYTLNDWFGAKVTVGVVGGNGVLLNNEMDDFTGKIGVPNLYGLLRGAANAIQPGKRPLSSISPTIATQDGKPLPVVGTPGAAASSLRCCTPS